MTRIGLLATFLIAVGMVTWDEVKNLHRVPFPARYLYIGIVWAVLGLISELGAPEIGAVFGVGLVVAMAYSFYTNKTPWPADLPYGPGQGPEFPGPM